MRRGDYAPSIIPGKIFFYEIWGKYSLQKLILTSDYCTVKFTLLVFVVLKNIVKIFHAVEIAFCKECLPKFGTHTLYIPCKEHKLIFDDISKKMSKNGQFSPKYMFSLKVDYF